MVAAHVAHMDSQVIVRLPADTKAEIEHLVYEVGLWDTKSDFIREAIEAYIQRHMKEEDRLVIR